MITYLLTKYQESSYSISGYSVINRFNFNCPICRQKINKDKIMHMLNIYEENLIKHKQNITKELSIYKRKHLYSKMSIKLRNLLNINVYIQEIYEFHKHNTKYKTLSSNHINLLSKIKIIQDTKTILYIHL